MIRQDKETMKHAVLQAGLGAFVCLDCLGLKKTREHERCNSCRAKKQWENLGFIAAHSGSNHPMFGKYHRKESLEKMSLVKKGKHYSEATRRKLSIALMNNKRALGHRDNEETREKKRVNMLGNQRALGYRHSDEAKRSISKNNAMKHHPEVRAKVTGSNCWNWQGGKSFEPYSTDWKGSLRRMILDRDDHRCQICNASENGKKHSVHHIDYNKKNCHPDNLTTLCQEGSNCHLATNSRRSYWPEFFKWLRGQKEADIALGTRPL